MYVYVCMIMSVLLFAVEDDSEESSLPRKRRHKMDMERVRVSSAHNLAIYSRLTPADDSWSHQ